MTTTVDVAVIGAGVHGAAAAFHLARRGVSVVLIERWQPAGGPTGRSSAVCRAYYTNAFLAACARDSIAMLERFEEETGVDAGHRRTGFVYLHEASDADAVTANAARLTREGIEVRVLGAAELAEILRGAVLDDVGVAAYEPAAGYADPHATTEGLAKGAVAAGAVPRYGRIVTSLAPVGPAGALLTLDDGETIAAGRVLVAAGPWTRPLALQAGADLPLTVERHVVATFRWGGAEPVHAHSDLIRGGYYFRPEGEDLFLMGPVLPEPQADPDDFDERIAPAEVERLGAAAVARVPRLEAAEVARGWASLYDVSPDWQPVIGEIAPGVFVDAGTSGHGFKLAPALGAHVAAMVLGEPAAGLEAFDPFRFAQGHELAAGYGAAKILG
ncbi:MAG TPA: FAD-dependent oxidoreductase [Actinomycetota bacterium]